MTGESLTPLPLKYIEGSTVSSPLRDFDRPQSGARPETDRMRELEQMLNEAQNRSRDVEREAYDKAYAAGEQAGMDLGYKRAEQMSKNIDDLLLQCEKSARRLHEHMDEVVLDIADAVIRHVVDTMLDEHPGYLRQMITQATRYLPDNQTLRLGVSVQDMSMFEKLLDDTPHRLVADDNIAPGTCRIMASEQDILIDPQAAINECMHHIRNRLLQKGQPVDDGMPAEVELPSGMQASGTDDGPVAEPGAADVIPEQTMQAPDADIDPHSDVSGSPET